MKTTLPVIHLNGTHPHVLLDKATEAVRDLRRALHSLEATEPNARDYYPLGLEGQGRALREHIQRLDRVRATLAELEALQAHILDVTGQ